MPDHPITIEDVRAAAGRIHPHVHRTPVHTCTTLSRLAGREIHFKCELFQRAGAFKFRGACNAVMKLSDAAAARGVVTHSSGNHGQALALAARLRGIAAHVVMPDNASPAKQRAVREYGASVVQCAPNLAARESTVRTLMDQTGAQYIPPYNHPDVIAGQGTMALELLEQVPDLDAIIAPIGGGGLISGLSLAARAVKPDVRVFGAEPAGADDAFRSKQSGLLMPQTDPRTIADGLRTSLGDLTWPVVRDDVERALVVTDEEISRAMRLVWERAKLMIEPSSAVAVAAVLGAEFRAIAGLPRIGVILSGGNVDLDQLPW
jgi:threonine dehydratase